MADAQEAAGGIILRGDDGSLYFIRDELLEACKTDGVYTERVQEVVDAGDDVSGFSMSLGSAAPMLSIGTVRQLQAVQSPVKGNFNLGTGAQGTTMCPW